MPCDGGRNDGDPHSDSDHSAGHGGSAPRAPPCEERQRRELERKRGERDEPQPEHVPVRSPQLRVGEELADVDARGREVRNACPEEDSRRGEPQRGEDE